MCIVAGAHVRDGDDCRQAFRGKRAGREVRQENLKPREMDCSPDLSRRARPFCFSFASHANPTSYSRANRASNWAPAAGTEQAVSSAAPARDGIGPGTAILHDPGALGAVPKKSIGSCTKAWKRALDRLSTELVAEDVQTWLKPMQARMRGGNLILLAPNGFVADRVRRDYLPRLRELMAELDPAVGEASVELGTGDAPPAPAKTSERPAELDVRFDGSSILIPVRNFVEGKSTSGACHRCRWR